ncbi:MAG: hypothetical protein ACXVJB_10230 [Mucilaginibacter sp.]
MKTKILIIAFVLFGATFAKAQMAQDQELAKGRPMEKILRK